MAGGGRIKGITIEIGGNTTKLESALKSVNSTISTTQTKLKDVDRLLKLDPTNTDLLKQKQGYLKDAIAATEEKLQKEKDALEQLKNADGTADTTEQQQALEREIVATEQALKNLKDQYTDFGNVASQVVTAAGDKMKEVGDKISDVGDKITGVGTSLSTHVTAPIVAVGAGAMKAFNDVDAGLDTVKAKTGATGTKMDELGQIMQDIATTIPTDFETAGAAVGEVSTRFGVTGDELEALSTKFIQFADLNNTDVATSVDTVQNALSSFNMGAGDAGTVLDVLNATAQSTGANVDSMASALVNNSTALQQMGMDIYQSVDFLGQLETAGADSEAVISGMKRALKDATDAGIPFDQALSDLENTILNGTSDMDGLSAAYDLFGKSGASVFQAVSNGQISFTDLADSQDILADSADNVASTYEGTLDPIDSMTTAMNSLKLAGSDLGSTIGDVLAPIIETLADKIQSLREWFSNLDESQQQTIVKVAMVAAAIGPLLIVIGTVISSVGSIISVIGTVVSGIGTLMGLIPLLAGPIGIVIAAIAAVVAIGVLLYQNWDTIKAKAAEIKDAAVEKFNAVKDGITNAINAVKDKVTEMKDAFTEKFDAVKETVSNAFDSVKETMGNVMQAAKDTVQEKLDNIKSAYEEHGGGVSGVVAAGMETIKGYYTTGYTFIDNLTGGKLSSVVSTVQSKMESAKSAVSSKLDSVKSYFSDKLSSALDTARSKFDSIKSSISDKLETAKTNVSNKLSSIKTAFSDKLGGALSTVRDKFDSIKNAISDKLTSARDKVQNLIDQIKAKFNFTWSLPHLKMPHPYITGSFSLNPPSVPSFGISWYKKAMDNAYMLDGPTIFGTMGGKLLGGGEAGHEMIIGRDTLLSMIGEAAGAQQLDTLVRMLGQYLPGIADRDIRLDGGALVGAMAPRMDAALGNLYNRKSRGGGR